MKRRKVVSYLFVCVGGSLLVPSILLTGCKGQDTQKQFLTDDDILILDEIGETIIPQTPSSPGAKAAKIGAFMKLYVTDCYSKSDQKIFINGIAEVNNESKKKFGDDFVSLTASQKYDLFISLDKQAVKYAKNKKKGEQDHYFSMMKSLTLFGYYTSEIGATQARRYISTPGYYNGNIPYKKGDKAWA